MVKIIFFVGFFVTNFIVFAQLGINTDGSSPHVSSMLDIKSTNKGMLIPRVELTGTNDVATITSAETSLMVYNGAIAGDVTPGFYYWDGSAWKRFASGVVVTGTGTATRVAFWGGTDSLSSNADLYWDDDNSRLGIGTTSPSQTLDVSGTIAYREGTALTLSNGSNNNITSGANSFIRIIGPDDSFTITGFQNGTDGKILTLYNTTSEILTIANNSSNSTDANRILTMTGSDITTPAGPNIVQLQYNATVDKWIIIGGQNLTQSGSGEAGSWLIYIVTGF